LNGCLRGSRSGGRSLRGGRRRRFLLFRRGGRAVVGYNATLGAGFNGGQPFLAFVFSGASKFTILFLLLVARELDPILALLRIACGGRDSTEWNSFGLTTLLVRIVEFFFFALEAKVPFLDLLTEETTSVLLVQFSRRRDKFLLLLGLLGVGLFGSRCSCRSGSSILRGGRSLYRSYRTRGSSARSRSRGAAFCGSRT